MSDLIPTEAPADAAPIPTVEIPPAKPAANAKTAAPKAKTAKPTKAPPAPAKPAVSFAARCRELFAAGKSNDEIWAILQPEFNSPDKVKGSIPWHRNMAKRKAEGRAPRTTAYEATLTWFLANCPKASSVVKAAEPTFALKVLAQATGKPIETVVADLRARIG